MSDSNVREQALNVSLTISPADDQEETKIRVKSAWAVKDLTIPLNHTRVVGQSSRWPHLRHVPFPEVQIKKNFSVNRHKRARGLHSP